MAAVRFESSWPKFTTQEVFVATSCCLSRDLKNQTPVLSGSHDWFSFKCPRLILLLESKLQFSTSFNLFLLVLPCFDMHHFFTFCYHNHSTLFFWVETKSLGPIILNILQIFFFTCRLH